MRNIRRLYNIEFKNSQLRNYLNCSTDQSDFRDRANTGDHFYNQLGPIFLKRKVCNRFCFSCTCWQTICEKYSVKESGTIKQK